MTEVIAGALVVVARLLRAVQKAFLVVPSRELRRRSAKGDVVSHRLYLAARYEGRLQLLLEISIITLVSGLAYIVFSKMETAWAIALSAVVFFYFFVVSNSTRSLPASRRLAVISAPYLAAILRFVGPILHVIQPRQYGQQRFQPLYDLRDLIDFLHAQAKLHDSRINKVDLERAVRALKHQDQVVKDVMVVKKNMKMLKEDEEVGPILLSELHGSGQTCFAVEDKKRQIVGVVSLNDLANMTGGGLAKDAAQTTLSYIKNDWMIAEAAVAFLDSKCEIFLVVDRHQKTVGIVSFEMILKSLLGDASEQAKRNYHNLSEIASE